MVSLGKLAIDVRLLGPFEVATGERVVEIGSPKQRLLLAMLVLDRNRVVSVDALAEELWGEQLPTSVPTSVQSLVSRLRHVFNAAGDEVRLRASGPGYVLELDDSAVDACRFEELSGRGRQAAASGAPDAAVPLFRQALALWRGPALAKLADRDFARPEATRLDEARREVVEELADAELAAGRPEAAHALLADHVAANPLRERAWGQLMVALYRLGRQAEALRAYQELRRILGEELGLEPTPALRHLEQQILVQSPELEGPSTPRRGSPRHNLPVALTPFIGREGELEELTRILPTTRLLTLTGVGGVGKTRLALELATRVRDRFDDGVWLTELASVRDPSLVALEVLAALGILTGGVGLGSTAPEGRLTDYLSSRSLLLILDNCEHVVEAVADLVQRILSRCPDVLVLATSREVLVVPGEAPWAVPCLSIPAAGAALPEDLAGSDAVTLFSSRASVAQPGFGLTPANANAIAQICRRLDGIPLALELAAARIRALGAHQLAAHLDDRFRLLSGGGRTAVSRHQTLRDAMDWSFELLSDAEQALLRRLSVFPQSFTLERAEAVGGDEAPAAGFSTIDLLVRLVDKSLVSVEDDGEGIRYHLLETVRQYGAEKLAEAGEAHEIHRRHRDFFLALAKRRALFGWWGVPWLRLVEADRENFQVALDWSLAEDDERAAVVFCGALWFYWFFTDRLASVRDRVQHALAGPVTDRSAPRVTALVGLAWALMESGGAAVAEAESSLRKAIRLAEKIGDDVALGQAIFTLGQLLHISGRDREAGRRLVVTALEIFVNLDPTVQQRAIDARVSLLAWVHHELGWIALANGQIDEAAVQFERGLELARLASDELAIPHLAADLALAAAVAEQSGRAELLAGEAIGVARSVPFRGILVMTLVRAAQAAALSGQQTRARATLRELLGLLRELGARRWIGDTLDATVLMLEADGRVEAAASLLSASDSLRQAFWQPPTALPALATRMGACRGRIAKTPESVTDAEPEPVPTDVDEVLMRARAELEREDGV